MKSVEFLILFLLSNSLAGAIRSRRFFYENQEDHCAGGLCAGIASYPVKVNGESTDFYAEFDVPGIPRNVRGTTQFIYFNIFFPNSEPSGIMNQFVPQLMAGNPLCKSSGVPLYKPIWEEHDTWVFGSQYFFEIRNGSSGKEIPHAATGELFPTRKGEVLWTHFVLDEDWVWTLKMGVIGDKERTSVLKVFQPYMGLLPEDETKSWSEATYNKCDVNSCWELYGIKDRNNYPSTGSTYHMRISVKEENAINWVTNWTENEKPTCPGHPYSSISESHSPLKQDIIWNISYRDTRRKSSYSINYFR